VKKTYGKPRLYGKWPLKWRAVYLNQVVYHAVFHSHSNEEKIAK